MAEYIQQISGFNTEPSVKYSAPSTSTSAVNVLSAQSFSRSLVVTSSPSTNYIETFAGFNTTPTVKYTSYALFSTGLVGLSNVTYSRSLQVTSSPTNNYIEKLGVSNVVAATSRVQFWSDF